MTDIFSAARRVELFCRFESELAIAQSEFGEVPAEAAEEIARACRRPLADPARLLAEGWEVGTPVVPVLEALRSRLDGDAARWLHHGATTQDVVDTSTMLQIKSGLSAIATDLETVMGTLAGLSDAHRDTVMMGRTLLQAAVPTTFGARAVLWLEPLIRHRADLVETMGSLPLQLGGPVGDGGSFPGFERVERLAARLELAVPVAPWHTDRSPVTRVVALVGQVASSMAKIATDVGLLASSGIEEVRVRSGGSSSMPHKHNPIDAVRAIAASRVCLAMTAGVIAGPAHERERSMGAWQAEWVMIPVVFSTAAATVEATSRCIDSIEVDAERMAANAGTAKAADPGLIDRVLEAYRA